jgi:membrane-associated protease RseP (regulator of RpoE activity)
MDFTIYDIILLAIFVVSTFIFLYKKRENLKKEGLLFLYKTKWGIKFIEKIGNKYKKTLNVLSYVSIALGYILMISMIYFFGKVVWIYVFQSQLVQMIKVPPIMPLIPYLPQIFKISYLPPFYFIYWIIIIAIVAISHEFCHGIFAANKKIKIKTTGFGFFPFFFPVFLAAFVELDEKRMEKKKILPQMAILSAGTFANIITALISFGILVLFFFAAFTPAGVSYDTYSYAIVGISAVTSVNNIPVTNASYQQILSLIPDNNFTNIIANETNFLTTKENLKSQNNSNYLTLYDDAPAIKANLSSTIIKINGVNVKSREQIANEIMKYKPGDKVTITTLEGDAYLDKEVILGKNPSNENAPYLGIGFLERQSSGILGKITSIFTSFRDPNIYYQSNFGAAEFVYDLLWWLVMISFSVALVNMLPVGIFDGGRFFYLTILGITKNKNTAKKAFAFVTYLFLFLLLIIMIFWALNLGK